MVGAHVVRKTLLISVSWHDLHLDRDYSCISGVYIGIDSCILGQSCILEIDDLCSSTLILIIMVQLILRIISIPDLALAILSMIMQSRVH